MNILNAAAHENISAAVKRAELNSNGEIVTIIAEQSDDYHDIAILWSMAASFLLLFAIAIMPDFYLSIFDWFLGGWGAQHSAASYITFIGLAMTLKFGGTYLFLLIKPLRFWLVPSWVKRKRVRARAIRLFRVGTESKTAGLTGVMLYLSTGEHRAELVADKAINDKVDSDQWGDIMSHLTEEIAQGNVEQAMVHAIASIGEILSLYFPKSDKNPNELPDRLIEL
ncbi:hypothetical protein LPB140_06635 [Sphingorhabdus lutea]|uniref:TPM domain-containing protein n=1 Tax=Sphingorhabdus lutea TaxID=1913578 RepID=A0A1L3JEY8_9SPHN|nr:hypothetical protein [Sphingorhabdus lutea]APG63669.1 hypothetical protein LPB140_06635 [Sphingorhabdus lutea]